MIQGGRGAITAVYIQGLEDLIGAIRSCDRRSEVAFKDLIVVAIKLMSVTTATALAGRLAHSKATISKWLTNPKVVPSQATREVAIAWIEEQAVARLSTLRQKAYAHAG